MSEDFDLATAKTLDYLSHDPSTEVDLTCQAGHTFWRKKQRGRPPIWCDEHKPVKDQPRAILRPNLQRQTSPSKSVLDTIPGLKQALTMETLFCEIGQHEWERESKRGRKPSNCPEHTSTGAIVRKVEKAQENKQKVREGLETAIAGLSARVAAATEIDDAAYLKLRQNPADEGSFKQWLRVNSRLLNEVVALRYQENKLQQIGV
jgi:hypothetical protein